MMPTAKTQSNAETTASGPTSVGESEQVAKKTLNTTSKRECSIESKESYEELPDPTKQARSRLLELSS